MLSITRHYARVYFACHADHVRRRSNQYRLTDRDSSLLAHLSQSEPITAAALARHLGVRPSTLSPALARLHAQDYPRRETASGDRRVQRLTLTATGEAAMVATSVLDRQRVSAMLARLSREQCRQAMTGLALLARAACELSTQPLERQ